MPHDRWLILPSAATGVLVLAAVNPYLTPGSNSDVLLLCPPLSEWVITIQTRPNQPTSMLLAADHKTKVLGDFCSIWLGTIATTIKLRQVLIAQLRVPFAASWWNWLG